MHREELDRLLEFENWAALSDAYGTAVEIPDLLRSLISEDAQIREQAYDDLYSRVAHQGVTRFEASSRVVPFLLRISEMPASPDLPHLLKLLAAIAIGDEDEWLQSRQSPAQRRARVQHETQLSRDELQEQLEEWVRSADTDDLRERRARYARNIDVLLLRDTRRWEVEAYDAVKKGIPVYLQLLHSEDATVSMWAAYLLGWFPEESSVIPGLLSRATVVEDDTRVGATIRIAMGLLGPTDNSRQFLSRGLESAVTELRWSSAIALALLEIKPSSRVEEQVADCAKRGFTFDYQGPYGSDLSGFARSLLHEPKAGLLCLSPDRILSPGLFI